MLETVILLTCLEANTAIQRVENNYSISRAIKDEIIIELLKVSECKDGDV